MCIKSCEPLPVQPDLYYWSLRNLHLSKRCEGQCRKGLSAEDASNTYHSLSSFTGGGGNGVGRPKGTSGSDCDFGVDIVAHRIQGEDSLELYICPFKSLFSLKCSCLPLRFAYTCSEVPVSRGLLWPFQKSAGHDDFEAGELNTHASDA
jgi:hypothetical protein